MNLFWTAVTHEYNYDGTKDCKTGKTIVRLSILISPTKGNTMKFKLIALCVLTLLLTSCLDIFHTVSLHKGKADVTVRYTIQKAMMDMIGSFSGEEMDYSEFDEIGDEIFGEYNDMYASVTPVNTPYNIGAEIKVSGKVSDISSGQDTAYFLPVKTERGYEILIPSLSDEEDTDETALSFMSGAKYTLLIDLSGDLKNIKKAGVKVDSDSVGSEETDQILVNIYGSSMVIEVPIILLFMAPEDFAVELTP